MSRTLLTSPTTFYVDNVNGNDANDGSTTALAFKKIQTAVDTLCGYYDWTVDAQPTIKLATTGVNYVENVHLRRYVGAGSWSGVFSQGAAGYNFPRIVGDPNDNTAVTVQTPAGAALACFTGWQSGPWIVDSLKLTSSDHFAINADANAIICGHNLNFGACGAGHITAICRSYYIHLKGPFTLSGGAPVHVYAGLQSIIYTQANSVSLVGNPGFTKFAQGADQSVISYGGVTFASGTCTSGGITNDGTASMYPTSNGNWP